MNTETSAIREIPLQFRASGGEYFRIWIVNLLLTIVTLGIYSAWAKVRRLRYFYGSTLVEGSSFEYHGRPIAILKGRLIVVGAYVIFLIASEVAPLLKIAVLPLVVFGVPWIIMRARSFQMRMTSWRGLRFNFHGGYGGALGAFIGWPMLAALTLFLLYPLALWKQASYIISNGAYGTQRFAFDASKGRFYAFCFSTAGIAIGAFCLAAVVFALLAGKGNLAQLMQQSEPDPREAARALMSGGVWISLLIYGSAMMLVAAWFRVRYVNTSIGSTIVGPHRLYSRMKTLPLFGILLTNLLGMVVTLGLFYPWAKVRAMRYQIENTGLVASGDLSQFVAESSSGIDAVGEEVSDFFDIDFGI